MCRRAKIFNPAGSMVANHVSKGAEAPITKVNPIICSKKVVP